MLRSMVVTGQVTTALVTGGSAGIGLETALGLARHTHGRVWITGRNEDRLRAAAKRLEEAGASEARWFGADFASLSEVRALAGDILSATEGHGLQVLVNNAGLWHPRRQTSADGFEDTFAVNHLASFLLTRLLLPALLRGGQAGRKSSRVVNVSSRLHESVAVMPSMQQLARGPEPYVGLQAYAHSKLCNLLFSNELARRLEGRPITSNAVHPGSVQTDVVRDNRFLCWGIRLVGPLLKSPAEGASTTLRVATDPTLEGVTGGYFANRAQRPPASLALDLALSRELWERSAELTALADSPSAP